MIGTSSAILFVSYGMLSDKNDRQISFAVSADALTKEFKTAFGEYKVTGQYIQETCSLSTNMTRRGFTDLYKGVKHTGLNFQVISWNMNVSSQQQRQDLEEEARSYYKTYHPHLNISYEGFVGLEPNEDGGLEVQPRSIQDVYFPVHYLEPLETNIAAIDFDLYSSKSRKETIDRAMTTWEPQVTPRLQLVQETDPSAYSVILMHPGIKETHPNLERPTSFSSVVLRIRTYLGNTHTHTRLNAHLV
jgi:hypothetical protein